MKNKKKLLENNIKAYEIPIEEHECGACYKYEQYYNEDIKKKVLLFYKKDFDFFTKHGFNYSI